MLYLRNCVIPGAMKLHIQPRCGRVQCAYFLEPVRFYRLIYPRRYPCS